MTLRLTRVALLAAAVTAVAPSTLADHIPGHDNDDPVFPVPLPDADTFSGGAIWLHAIGPVGGSTITNARFDITWYSDGETPASNLRLNVGLLVDDGDGNVSYVETIVTGADLGFDATPGTQHGIFETTDLNGIAVENFLLPPYSSLDVIVDAVDGGIQGTGYFVDSFIYFDVVNPPACTGDLDGDHVVGFGDLVGLLGAWGQPADGGADLDGDQVVGFGDLSMLLSLWGPCD